MQRVCRLGAGSPLFGREGAGLALPALCVTAAMVTFEVGWGANLGSALLFMGFELGFAIVPGLLLYRVLASRPGGPIRQLALGWTLGTVLEIIAFMITAALGARWAFSIFPLLVVIPSSVLLIRRRSATTETPTQRDEAQSRRFAWSLAAVCMLAMGLMALAFFPGTPAPGTETFTYFRDFYFHLGLAGEAKNGWPVHDPNVSGVPQPYHFFAHLHMAAASQVTGIELPLVYFRFFNLPLVVLSILLLVSLGTSFARSAWTGLLAAMLMLFVGDLQLQTNQDLVSQLPFLGAFVTFLGASPSFLFGLPIFLALMLIVGERITAAEPARAGEWAIVALLVFGATNSKVTILPILLCALALFAVWSVVSRRRLPGAVLATGFVAILAGGITYQSQYAGHSSGLVLEPFGTIDSMPVVSVVKAYLAGSLDLPAEALLLGLAGIVVGLLGLLGPQIAAASWGKVLGRPALPAVPWLLALTAAGLLIGFMVQAPSTGNQLYFVMSGVVPASFLAAIGLSRLWRARPREIRFSVPVALISTTWLIMLVTLMRAPIVFDLFSGADAPAQTFIFWYAGLGILLTGLVLAAHRLLVPSRWWSRLFVCAALVLVGAIGSVANYVVPGLSGAPPSSAEAPTTEAVTPDLYGALSWVRDNTPDDAVIAANTTNAFDFKRAAFAQRPTFVAGTAYTREATDRGYDKELARGFVDINPDRRALNAAAFAGDPAALATLEDEYGVGFLVIDTSGNLPVDPAALAQYTTSAFEAPTASVLRLDGAPPAPPDPSG